MIDKNNPGLEDEIIELTLEEAHQWLSFTEPWSIEEAALIFAGHSPRNRRFFKDDDADRSAYAYNYWERFKLFERQGKTPASQAEWVELLIRNNWSVPEALARAINPNKKENISLSIESNTPKEVNHIRGVSGTEIAQAFDGIHADYQKWKKYLSDPSKWLLTAQMTKGLPGRQKKGVMHEATWNPLIIATSLSHKGYSVAKISKAFETSKELSRWKDQWAEYKTTHLQDE